MPIIPDNVFQYVIHRNDAQMMRKLLDINREYVDHDLIMITDAIWLLSLKHAPEIFKMLIHDQDVSDSEPTLPAFLTFLMLEQLQNEKITQNEFMTYVKKVDFKLRSNLDSKKK